MRARASSPLPWLGGLLALYLLVPIVAFVVRLAGGAPASPGLGSAVATSLLTATVSATVITLLGTPLAYLMARKRGVLARVLLALVALPLALPAVMSGVLLLYVVGPFTILGELFDGKLTDTKTGIILAQIFVSAPFLIIAARAAFAAVDPALEEVAATLGYGRFARFARVAVPAALPGISAGIMLSWLRAFSEFGATVILAYHPFSLPVFTFVQFDETGLPGTMLPVAAALAVALVVLLLTGLLPLRMRRSTVAAPTPMLGPMSTASPMPPARPTSTAGPMSTASPMPPARPTSTAGPMSTASPMPPAPPASPPALDFALSKRVGGFSLEVTHRARGPRLALLGPSGAGKTMTLRLLAGLIASEGGHIRAGSLALERIATERRQVGYVPQHPALLPRHTVWRQVTFGVAAQPGLAAWWLGRLGLEGLEHRYPDELSGGQQRRVALARALAIAPRVLLLDEPFTGLDAPVRDRLRRELRRLQREAGLCTVLVTHDPEEAALLADEIIVLDGGRVLQAGTRAEVFASPGSPHIAALLGIANARRGVAVAPDILRSDGAEIHVLARASSEGDEVVWCVRPERIALDPLGRYEAIVLDEVDLGFARELTVAVAGELELTVRTAATTDLRVGAPVRLSIAPEDVTVWSLSASRPADGGSSPAGSPFLRTR
jgi:ABC-type sulfate/molybdate transport systems ATPase subunit/ABC-type sulfate transport system permease component